MRTDNEQADNDLKYRYVKMKGEATPEQLVELENLFGPNRDNERIRLIRETWKPTRKRYKDKRH